VKEIAKSAGFEWLTEKKSSSGICFIGKRNFARFVDKYISPAAGSFHSLDGTVLGT
jgi:tRNA-specific 2-thiouridylase